MKTPKRIALPGSYKKRHTAELSELPETQRSIDVTVRIRGKKSLEKQLLSGERISHKNYEKEFGASQKDVARVEAFAEQFHLSTVEVSLARRSLILRGSVQNMEAAFGVELDSSFDDLGNPIRVREGEIFIPAKLKDIIEGVFGLDNRPVARAMFQVANAASSAVTPKGVDPNKLADIYGFPSGFDGTGQTIAILELAEVSVLPTLPIISPAWASNSQT